MVVGSTSWDAEHHANLGLILRVSENGRLAIPAATSLADTETIVTGISITPDGAAVVVGYGAAGWSGTRHFILVRILPDGTLDPQFGHHGLTRVSMRSGIGAIGDAARTVVLQDDSNIIVAGTSGYASGPLSQAAYCATARLSSEGRPDDTFGNNGRVLTLVPGKNSCGASAVLAAPSGEIAVVGSVFSEGPNSSHHIALLRYLPSGVPDPNFGQHGIAELEMEATACCAILDGRGRIVVVGNEHPSRSSNRFLLARVDGHGSLDKSFGESGILSFHESTLPQTLKAAALQKDGKIVVLGTLGWHSGGRAPDPDKRDEIAVLRLEPDGVLDKAFADNGVLVLASPRYLWSGAAIALQPDGKIVVAGSVEESDGAPPAHRATLLVRLLPDGTPDAEFGSGIDTW
jgi:uncharacterized delta-60 repeat protein